MKKVVIDVFGSDTGVTPILEGSARALLTDRSFDAVFAGSKRIIEKEMTAAGIPDSRYSIIDTEEYITNLDSPSCVCQGRDKASMVLALERLRDDDDCVGMVSAGNTGALLVGTIFRLGLAGGLRQPALSSMLPVSGGGFVCLVDCGASLDCKPKELARFALMGNAFMQSMYSISSPRIGLLSVGREESKGNAQTKEAYGLISALPLNFIGNIEGNDVCTGFADVVVCDGFSGNILLKNTEAVGKQAAAIVESFRCKSTPETDELISAIKARLLSEYDLNSQGGATFLGTKKAVVKMHGCATSDTAFSCINQVIRLESMEFSKRISDALCGQETH